MVWSVLEGIGIGIARLHRGKGVAGELDEEKSTLSTLPRAEEALQRACRELHYTITHCLRILSHRPEQLLVNFARIPISILPLPHLLSRSSPYTTFLLSSGWRMYTNRRPTAASPSLFKDCQKLMFSSFLFFSFALFPFPPTPTLPRNVHSPRNKKPLKNN